MNTVQEITFADCGYEKLPEWTNSLSSTLREQLHDVSPKGFESLNQMPEHWHGPALPIANSMANAGCTDEQIKELLEAAASLYSGEVVVRDIERVLKKCRDDNSQAESKKLHWPSYDKAKADEVLAKHKVKDRDAFLKCYDKPERTEPWEILECLFPGDPLLCLAESKRQKFRTQKLSAWKATKSIQNFLVPSPMSKPTGLTKDGKESGRCLDNTGPRSYLVIEFDREDHGHNEQFALISHLATLAPLVMVLDTGSKSLHAWFKCHSQDEHLHQRFMMHAVSLGADKATWRREQLVRLPGGTHDKTGNSHKLLVFRPSAANGEQWKNCAPSGGGRYTLTHHSEIAFDPTAFDFVEGLLTVGGLSVVYAAPGIGKSFFILDLAASVATGTTWRDKEVHGGPVVYFCLEGQKGFKNRLLLLQRAGKLPTSAPFHFVSTALDFFNEKDLSGFIQAIAETLGDTKPQFIIIDTLARSMPGGNENAGEDMGKAIDGAGALQSAFGAHVCLVHHSGKDASRGTRGHSSLKGAVDTEIELTKDTNLNIITAEVTKQKDLEQGQRFPFRLLPLEVGTNDRGKPVTSCTVSHLDQSEAPAKKKRGRNAKHSSDDLLSLLPVHSVSEWKSLASQKLSIPNSSFYRLKNSLIAGIDYTEETDGKIIPPGG